MSELVDAAVNWLASDGPPNWLFVLALLTAPAKWSRTAVSFVRSRLQENVHDGG